MAPEQIKTCIKCQRALPESEGCYIERRVDERSRLHFVCPACLDAQERSTSYVIWLLALFFVALLGLLFLSWKVGGLN